MDDSLKDEAAQVFENLGIDISTAVRMFLKRAVMENGIPFRMRFRTISSVLHSVSSPVREMVFRICLSWDRVSGTWARLPCPATLQVSSSFMVTANAAENSQKDNSMESLKAGRVTRAEYLRSAANICRYHWPLNMVVSMS